MAHGLLRQVRRGESIEYGLPSWHHVFGSGTGNQPTRRDGLVAETAPGSSFFASRLGASRASASHLPRPAQGMHRAPFQSSAERTRLHPLLTTPGDSPGQEGLQPTGTSSWLLGGHALGLARLKELLSLRVCPLSMQTSSCKPSAGVRLAQLQSGASSYLLLQQTRYYQIICL